MEISWDDQVLWDVTIKYIPFNPGCTFESKSGDGGAIHKLFFSAQPRGLKEACFELDKNYCKLRSIKCPWDKY
jgi:hypothetical protein